MEIKLDDVYKFTYNEEWSKKLFQPYWCFDGQLIVKRNPKGKLYLEDTYWNCSDNKTFSLEEAKKQGTLTFICNLNDVEKCNVSDLNYYADEDIFDLSRQHNCYKEYYKRKDAKKSPEKMEKVLTEKIQSTEHQISWRIDELQRLKEKLESLMSGNHNIYI